MKLVVGVADLKTSRNPDDLLITYSLGSCIGICIFDPVAMVGGLLHYMLPESSLSPGKAAANPCMFADTGIPHLFRECYRLGAVKERLIVKAVGGAQVLDSNGTFNIGKRNILMMRKLFWQNGVTMGATALGGTVNRTVSLELRTGSVLLRASGEGVGPL
jgi:chemotaxis protein CheD